MKQNKKTAVRTNPNHSQDSGDRTSVPIEYRMQGLCRCLICFCSEFGDADNAAEEQIAKLTEKLYQQARTNGFRLPYLVEVLKPEAVLRANIEADDATWKWRWVNRDDDDDHDDDEMEREYAVLLRCADGCLHEGFRVDLQDPWSCDDIELAEGVFWQTHRKTDDQRLMVRRSVAAAHLSAKTVELAEPNRDAYMIYFKRDEADIAFCEQPEWYRGILRAGAEVPVFSSRQLSRILKLGVESLRSRISRPSPMR